MPSAVDPEDVRLAVYDSFRRLGRAPSMPELVAAVQGNMRDVRAALRSLHKSRDVVLGDDGEIVMAHPFTCVPLGFAVMGRNVLWWGGCAWDSFAIPNLIPEESTVVVSTTCPACGRAHAWNVDDQAPPAGEQVAHFLVPAEHIWDDVVRSCANQRIFCSEDCVEAWLARTSHERGYVMDLTTLWNLSKTWYAGRLTRGYQRREPVAAAEYFAKAGLQGSFWGLPD